MKLSSNLTQLLLEKGFETEQSRDHTPLLGWRRGTFRNRYSGLDLVHVLRHKDPDLLLTAAQFH